AAIDEMAGLPGVVAIGEIGLDYYWEKAERDDQMSAFEAQLELARRHGLPVVIHSRDAMDDTVRTLESWAGTVKASATAPAAAAVDAFGAPATAVPGAPPASDMVAGRPLGVMHCYSGDLATAERLVASGFLISLAGNVTYPKATNLHDVAAGLPDHALVLETDSPYLTPQPFRGRRNEPARVKVIAEHVAELRGTTLDAVATATSANAVRLFGLEEPLA
ncbi:MAG: TatD family hydrolase, partial [Anaerolineae bacterium]